MERSDACRMESLGGKVFVCVSETHRFGTDAFLLADFAAPKKREKVVDLCSGNGIIPLYIYKEYSPESVIGIELQRDAAELFLRGIKASEAEETIRVIREDLKEASTLLAKGTFDLVTCNPPYWAVGTGKQSRNDAVRAARHETECTIEDVCRVSGELLRFGGRLCLCQRPDRLADVLEALRRNRIEPKRLRFVAKEPASRPWLFLLEGRRGGNPSLQVEPMLYLKEGGEYFSQKRSAGET